MMLLSSWRCCLCLMLILAVSEAFIPLPVVAYSVQSSQSITHAEITQLGFIRSLARYLYDTRIGARNSNGTVIKEEDFLTVDYTVDELYELAYPEYNAAEAESFSLPLKFILDVVMTEDGLVDFNENTRHVAAAHFDGEAFANASRRIIEYRQSVLNNTLGSNQDFETARALLGQLLHTLQDFYSHSNWVEMGQTDVNELIGFNETIGTTARPDQATCTSTGCTKIEKTCTLWQEISLGVCPLVYYDCQNNILPEINSQHILTTGYAANDVSESGELLQKPTNVDKCSHGSVLDASSNIPAIGGINKDSYSLVFSPHANLHKTAADLAVTATERFINDLRRDMGDENFDFLFGVNPSEADRRNASDALAQGKRFRFFSPNLAAYMQKDDRLVAKVKRFFHRIFRLIKYIWSGRPFTDQSINQPTYDLSDQGVNMTDPSNFRAAPYILRTEQLKRKR